MRLYTTQAEKVAEALLTIRTSLIAEEQLSAVEALCDIHREHMTIEFADTVDLIQYNDKEVFEADRNKRVKERVRQLYNI